MKPLSSLVLAASLALCSSVSAEALILYDGETPRTDLSGKKGGGYYQLWWGGENANSLTDSRTSPRSGKNCAMWKCDAGWSGGSLLFDPSWIGVNIEPMTNLEFWVRGERGGERIELSFFDKNLGKPGDGSGFFKKILLTNLGTEWKRFVFSLSDLTQGRPGKRPLDLAIFQGIQFSGSPKGTVVYFDDMRFGMKERLEIVYAPIKLNRIGHRPGDRKYALINRNVTKFEVVDSVSKKTVFSGVPVMESESDRDSGDLVMSADFSALKTSGTYFVRLPDGTRSPDFRIAEDVYSPVLTDWIRSYYYQRCNIELEQKHAGKWTRERCHTNDIRAGFEPRRHGDPILKTVDLTGGWHDAGDDNQYTWMYGILWALVQTYDLFPSKFPDGQLNIPESGNGRSDLVDEIVYETRRLVKMQVQNGREAGLAYEKLASYTNEEVPYLQTRRRLRPPRTDSTGGYGASMAMMAWFLSKQPDPDSQALAKECRDAALKAWNAYLRFSKNGKVEYPSGRKLKYDVWKLRMASELYRLTGEERFHKIVRQETDGYIRNHRTGDIRWGAGKFEPFITYCSLPENETDSLTVKKMKDTLREYRDLVDEYVSENAYRVPFGNVGHFCWGSNGHLSSNGIIYYYLYLWDGQDADLQKVKRIVDYLMGLNAVDQIMFTGWGSGTLLFHGIWARTKDPDAIPPGYIVGGVNMHDGNDWMSRCPQKRYRNTITHYSVNENSIGYQAVAVFCLSVFVP